MRRKVTAVLTLVLAVAILAVPALGQETLKLAPAIKEHSLRIRFWAGNETSRALVALPGKESRDLGASLRQAARAGKLKPVKGGPYTFVVEFINLAFEQARSGMVRLNGTFFHLPPEFGMPDAQGLVQRSISVDVTDGLGRLEISKAWVRDDTIVKVHLPRDMAGVHYPAPPNRSLVTCSRERVSAGQCGVWNNPKASEFANLARDEEFSNYHFVQ